MRMIWIGALLYGVALLLYSPLLGGGYFMGVVVSRALTGWELSERSSKRRKRGE